MQIRDLIPWGQRRTDGPRRYEDNPLMSLQRDVNRIFEDFWRRFESPAASNGAWALAAPRTDIAETDKGIEISVELPGIDEKDVEASLRNDMLTIRGEKKSEREESDRGYLLSERSYGAFHRAILLPPGVDTDKADATFKNGVLNITLPRSPDAERQAKRIEVKAA